MFTIDIILKMSPMAVSVQRKDAESADALYKSITEAMQEPNGKLLELTCDKQPDKKVAIFSNQISAVVVSDKTSSAAAGRAPGFLSIGEIS